MVKMVLGQVVTCDPQSAYAASQDFFGVTIMHNDIMNYSESVGFSNRLLQPPHQARHDQEQ